MAGPDGWIKLHPLSPLLVAGKFVLLGLVLSFQVWADQATDPVPGGSLSPGAGVVVRVGAALVLGGLAALVYAAVAWRFRMYRVTPEMVELKTGIVFRSYRHLPFDRIESVDTAEPLIPRLLGLAEVRVEAISKRGSELRLRYLAVDEAERLRLELAARGRSRASEPQTPPASATAILEVPARELVMGYLVIPAVTGAAVVVIGGTTAWLVSGRPAAVSLVLIGVLASVTAVVRALVRLERLWGFRLQDAGPALVVNRGLLNLTTQRIVTGRVQALRIDQPLLWRPYGRYRVLVDVAGYRGARDGTAAEAAVLLPVAPDRVVRSLIQRLEVRADLAALPYEPVPRRARWRSLRWRSLTLARTDTHVIVRWGVLWRRTAIVPRQRVQSAGVSQGPWQRRLRLASLRLDTAGSRIRVVAAHRDAHDAVELADESARLARQTG